MPPNKSLERIVYCFICEKYLIWTAFSIPQGQIRLLFDTVKVFMKPVQQKGQQLLGVLLLVAGELGGKTSNLCLRGKFKKKKKN